MADSSPRYTLRLLPLPAKLVISAFLLSVGLGYVSAMVQLHMQHSDRDGTPLPTTENVIAIFAGKRRHQPDQQNQPITSKLEAIISGDPKANDLTARNMTPAFFHLDDGDFDRQKKLEPQKLPELLAEREGERLAVLAWIRSEPDARRRSYLDDRFGLPQDRIGQPLTPAFRMGSDMVRIQTLLNARCARCHQPGGEKPDVPLTAYEHYLPFLPAELKVIDGWVDSGRLISLEKLTQSTHAHLLSFAVLFGLTGFIFSFTSYPALIRGILGPGVLIAQVADISCWWLARLDPPYGPAFASCILITGGIVGCGLCAQILLSLFNMYATKGKAVLILLGLATIGLAGIAKIKVVDPFLDRQRQQAQQPPLPSGKGQGQQAATQDMPTTPSNDAETNAFLHVLDGRYPEAKEWGKKRGGMVRAFYDKEDGNDFRNVMKEGTEQEKEQLIAERRGEHDAVIAWAKLAEELRKQAYETDHFSLPKELSDKPLTPDYISEGFVKIRTIINDRCIRCHSADGEQSDIPLDSYDGLRQLLTQKSSSK